MTKFYCHSWSSLLFLLVAHSSLEPNYCFCRLHPKHSQTKHWLWAHNDLPWRLLKPLLPWNIHLSDILAKTLSTTWDYTSSLCPCSWLAAWQPSSLTTLNTETQPCMWVTQLYFRESETHLHHHACFFLFKDIFLDVLKISISETLCLYTFL